MPDALDPRATPPPPTPGGWARARQVSEAVAVVLLAGILIYTFREASRLRPFGVQASTNQGVKAPPQPPPQPGDLTAAKNLQAQVDDAIARAIAPLNDEIKTREDQQRSVLDRLVPLVGGYSLLIGLTAYFSLRSAREEAQNQVGLSASQLDNHMRLSDGMLTGHLKSADDRVGNVLKSVDDRLTNYLRYTNDSLELVRKSASDQLVQNKGDWAEFRTQIWSEIPDMRTMQRGLRSLLFELEKLIAPETDWNDERAYEALNGTQKQEIYISELTIAALPTLISREAPESVASLARLYRALARFYFGKYKVEKNRADGDRADAYIGRALRIDPEHAGSYRLRGAIYLAEQRLSPPPPGQVDVRLQDAQTNLELALKKDTNELGAYYNLAITLERQGERAKGIDLIRAVLKRLPEFSEPQKRKYLAFIVSNQACDLNVEARPGKDPKLHAEVVRVVTGGWKALKDADDSNGMASLKHSIHRELALGGDLHDLPQVHKTALFDALK